MRQGGPPEGRRVFVEVVFRDLPFRRGTTIPYFVPGLPFFRHKLVQYGGFGIVWRCFSVFDFFTRSCAF